jgi:hypothetical protein
MTAVAGEAWRWQLGGGVVVAAPAAWRRRWRQLGGVDGGSLAAEWRLQLSGGCGSTAAVAAAAVVAV